MTDNDDLFAYVLRLGDTALVLGQRLSEWTGHAPALEEDIALANIALDLVGQARQFLTYAGEVEGEGRDEDALAYLRDDGQYRNLLIVEQPNGDFAVTMVRQLLVSAWMLELYTALERSADERLAAIAAKAVKEVRYHVKHAAGWVIRLGDGTDESHRRARTALTELWMFTGEMFEGDAVDAAAAEAGVGVDPSSLKAAWDARIDAVLAEATLERPADGWMPSGGKAGRHTEYLSYLLAEMQVLQRTHPGARW